MYTEVSREIGGHPFHWGRLVNYSELFQSYLYVCRDQVEEEYRGRLINTFAEKIRRRRQRQQQRRKSSSPQSVASPSAATPTPPGRLCAEIDFCMKTSISAREYSTAAPAERAASRAEEKSIGRYT